MKIQQHREGLRQDVEPCRYCGAAETDGGKEISSGLCKNAYFYWLDKINKLWRMDTAWKKNIKIWGKIEKSGCFREEEKVFLRYGESNREKFFSDMELKQNRWRENIHYLESWNMIASRIESGHGWCRWCGEFLLTDRDEVDMEKDWFVWLWDGINVESGAYVSKNR